MNIILNNINELIWIYENGLPRKKENAIEQAQTPCGTFNNVH